LSRKNPDCYDIRGKEIQVGDIEIFSILLIVVGAFGIYLLIRERRAKKK
jgi:hypothetical protein